MQPELEGAAAVACRCKGNKISYLLDAVRPSGIASQEVPHKVPSTLSQNALFHLVFESVK